MQPSNLTLRSRSLRVALLLMLLLVVLPQPVAASTSEPGPYVIAVPPRGSIRVAVKGHCLQFGLDFPGNELAPLDVADDNVRAVILHSLAEGYYASDELYQTQWAIWHFTDRVRITADEYELASEIVDQAKGATPQDLDANSVSLLDAVNDEWVSVSLKNFRNISSPAYFGQGTLLITNLTDKTQVLHLPYGMAFRDVAQEGVQDMAIFPAGVPQVEGDSLATKDNVCNQVVVDLPADASTKVLIKGYGLHYGLPVPGQSLRPGELTEDVIRNTVCYNIDQGYLQSDLWQAQLAVWRQTDGLDKGDEAPLTQDIVAYAESGVQPGDMAKNCTALDQAIEQGIVSADIDDFAIISDPGYFGKGTMNLKNLTGQDQSICIPFGTRYKDETQSGVQDMAIFPSMRPDPDDVEAQQVQEVKPAPEVLPESGGAVPAAGFSPIAGILPGVALMLGGYALRRLKGIRKG